MAEGEDLELKKTNLEKIILNIEKEMNNLTHPIITAEIKKFILDKIVDNAIKKSIAYRLVCVLISDGKIKIIGGVYDKFVDLYLKSKGMSKLVVKARYQLSKEEEDKISYVFESIAGEKPVMDFKVDDNIIGGFLMKWEDKVFDSTINKKIDMLKTELEKEMQL